MNILAATILLPLALMALGLWETARSTADLADATTQRDRLAAIVATLQARQGQGAPDRFDRGLEFRQGGQLYGGPYAVVKAREALDDLETALRMARARLWLPPIVVPCAGLAAALSITALLGATLLGRLGRVSREALVRGFSAVRRVLPALMAAQVVLMAAASVAAIGFETLALVDVTEFSGGSLKLFGLGVVMAGLSLMTAGRALWQLRRVLATFSPGPLSIEGRLVTPAEAPALWQQLTTLAAKLGALLPDNVVVGMTGGFFVTSGPKTLAPSGTRLSGRTLYLPLPLLPLLQPDEVAAIIAHELAHFSGHDTEWSLRFLPIYAGVGRSLDAVALPSAGSGKPERRGAGSFVTSPSLRLGVFVMDRFHHAVRHWSRQREFAADAASATAVSPEAAARALLRTSAVQASIDRVLGAAAKDPGTAPQDLVSAILHQAAEGIDDPASHLEDQKPHPTDTHPPTSQRLLALHRPPTPAMLAEVGAPPGLPDLQRLDAVFADPHALCLAASADFLDTARARHRDYTKALAALAGSVAPDQQALHEAKAGAVFLLGSAGVVAAFGLVLLIPVVLQTVGLPDHGIQMLLIPGTALTLAAMLGTVGGLLLRRTRNPFLLLRPDTLALPGLDRPIAWNDVADLDVTQSRRGLVTRLLLQPGAPFPARRPGARRVRLEPKQQIVTFWAVVPRGMTPQAYLTLLGRYRRAADARRLLQQDAERPGPPPG